MTQNKFMEKMRNLFDEAEFDMDSNLADFREWDSLGHLSFMSIALTEGKRIPAANIRAAKKVSDLYDMVKDEQ